MIKLPIVLETRPDWQGVLADAILCRAELEAAALFEEGATGEYVRPLVLLQAQPHRQGEDTLTVEVVEKALLEDHKVPPAQIARATGVDRGLEGVDLLDPACPIRFVITIQALREGWDCPFAYVLCTVASVSSPMAVEQILGRVMRLPHAQRKRRPELNRAYAFAASASFGQVANTLRDALVECHGFERQEASDLIAPMAAQPQWLPFGPLFAPPVAVVVSQAPELAGLPSAVAAKVVFDPSASELTLLGSLDDSERAALRGCFASAADQAAVDRLGREVVTAAAATVARSPSERGEKLAVPLLVVKQGDMFEVFEDSHFLDHPWNLAECDAALSPTEFPDVVEAGEKGEITVSDEGRVQTRFVQDLRDQVHRLEWDLHWSVAELIYWLDHKIPHPDITPTESGIFLNQAIMHLTRERGLDLSHLLRERQRLRAAVEAKIAQHRQEAHRRAYQALLLEDCPTPLVVEPSICFQYPASYPYNTRYDGPYQFSKHYYPMVGDLKHPGEEFQCAQLIDTLPEVECWVRNLSGEPEHSFWLQTSTDRFYPDFVCQLRDGRYLVVEYKGEDRWSNEDSEEKRNLGELWEARSGGRCLFTMPKGHDFNAVKGKLLGGGGQRSEKVLP